MAVKITNNEIEGFVDEPYFTYDSSQDTFATDGVNLLNPMFQSTQIFLI